MLRGGSKYFLFVGGRGLGGRNDYLLIEMWGFVVMIDRRKKSRKDWIG